MTIKPRLSRAVLASSIVLLLTIWGCYYQALPGYWLYDDWPNLAGLSEVNDLLSAGNFILSGHAGDLGRPISLATFALQADAWNQKPEVMLSINFIIHTLAVTACFAFIYGLSLIRFGSTGNASAQWIAFFTATLWGLSPFLATTHLMVIQRMTSLSGLFTLLGLAFFVWAHIYNARQQSKHTLLLLLAGPGLMTLLATLSKENGALLPLFGGLIMWLWIPSAYKLKKKTHRAVVYILILIPTLLLMGYLLHGLFDTLLRGSYGSRRYFTPTERLLTQPLILWDYVRWLFLPKASAVNPFTDNLPAAKDWFEPPTVFFASLCWLILLFVCATFRKRTPAITLGVTFFLVGHVLESSYIGLELYFAHRNYIPSIGLYFALVYTLFSTLPASHKIIKIILSGYALLFATVLLYTTASWNNSAMNGLMWTKQNPYSSRASQFLANQYMKSGSYVESRDVLDNAASNNPENILLQIQSLNNCVHQEKQFNKKKNQVLQRLRHSSKLEPLAAYEVSNMAEFELQAPLCKPRNPDVLVEIADALLNNPIYYANSFARSKLHLAKAFVFSHQDKDIESAKEFIASFENRADLDVAFYGAALMSNMGEYEMAHQFISMAESRIPSKPLAEKIWHERLQEYRKIIVESELIDNQQNGLQEK